MGAIRGGRSSTNGHPYPLQHPQQQVRAFPQKRNGETVDSPGQFSTHRGQGRPGDSAQTPAIHRCHTAGESMSLRARG